ncbi:pilus assembly protein TadG-related protein [Trichococcus shcherbakoviae]|uniref:pilus assembly protein TadG-related protein n=1 Tax=Trichococcus shcherbakoviae TaxID=2094020 RepID=UPI002AA7E594|nr:pilus assembly protein TadG-related protein [Trichococcus shcherbakoviae]
MMKIFKRLHEEESGQSLIMVVLLLGVLLSFSALVVDVGLLYAEKAKLQNAADAAALAGAQVLPNKTLAEGFVETYAGANGVSASGITDISYPDGDNKKIKVEVESDVPYIFANFLDLVGTGTSVTASATAEKDFEWNGEALPFINLDDDYSKDSKIVAWEKTGPGDFESLWADEYKLFYGDKKDDHSKTYFTIDYMNGIEVTKGTVATIKQEVGYIYEQNKPVYIFSLSSDAIEKGDYTDIKNKDVIPLAALVLLQVTFDSYDYSGKTLFLTVTEVYDIKNGVFPTEYLNDDSAGGSHLIE